MSRNDPRREEGGQTLIIVALMLSVLFGFVGLVADIGWYELNLIRVQRAADAAALAGVVFLPTNVSGAVTAAKNESAKNGFTGAVKDVRDAPDASNGTKLDSQGFWAAVLTRGGQHSNGDAFSPAYDGGTNPNAQFDANGYSYTVEIPSGSSMGEVWLFDATFCAVGH